MNQEFKGKNVLVTGSARDIGRSIAVRFGKAGANVVVNYLGDDRDLSGEQQARETVDLITEAGGKAVAVKGDVTKTDDIKTILAASESAFGAEIHVLVNNVGGLIRRVPVVDMPDSHWDQVMDVNLKSVFYMCRAIIPKMQPGSAIVNISSLAARDGGGPGAIAYATAKGAVLTFTRGLAKELAKQNIRVNTVDPGVISTRFHDVHTNPEVRKTLPGKIPLGREGHPDEVANVIHFLASEESSYMTGQALQINGGMFSV